MNWHFVLSPRLSLSIMDNMFVCVVIDEYVQNGGMRRGIDQFCMTVITYTSIRGLQGFQALIWSLSDSEIVSGC